MVERNADQPSKNRLRSSVVLPVIVVVIGLLVMLYPVVSTAWNNWNTSRAAQEYARLDEAAPQQLQDSIWDSAHKYNRERTMGPIFDPWLDRIGVDSPEYEDYLKQLGETDAMARLIFPAIDVDLPIYHGTSDETLQRGLGHLYGSDLPVGGQGTHSIITGHTGLSNSTMFDHLKSASEGDEFYFQVAGHKLKYVVDEISVVLPHEVERLRPVDGQDYVTLITCTPYGINTHRLLVRGHQVPIESGDEEVFDNSHGPGWQWWMYALLTAVVIVGCWFTWWLRRQHKNRLSTSGKHRQKSLKNKNSRNPLTQTSGDAEKYSNEQNNSWERDDDGV
nr:class C sortase [Corynebacterium segmentosum]